jgi:hypothetical protein
MFRFLQKTRFEAVSVADFNYTVVGTGAQRSRLNEGHDCQRHLLGTNVIDGKKGDQHTENGTKKAISS